MNIRNNSKAFSLVEMMVTLMIFTIIVAGVYSSAVVGDASFQANKVRVELQQELRKAAEGMRDDLREAGPSSIANVPADGAWYPQIMFKKPAGVVAGALVWESDYTQFQLAGVNGDQLHRTDGSGSRILANDIDSLLFRRLTAQPDILDVALVGQESTLKGTEVRLPMQFQIQLRNR